MKNLIRLILLTTIFLAASCKTKQKLLYFQQKKDHSDSIVKSSPFDFHYQAGDIVSITVSCADPELVKPFNTNFISTTSNAQDGYETGSSAKDGYFIDQSGEILFPVIGKIKLEGLTKTEAVELITGEIKRFVKDPIVSIRVSNFKVTVLGSVLEPGTFHVPNERMTIFEALALAKDLKITGLRKSVLLIRENKGKKEEYRLDLTTKDVFSSPAYYLKQNDIIYVEPNLQERYASTVFKNTFITAISAFTVILTALNIIVSQ